MTDSRLKVAIVGGGIGGLTLAVALGKCDNVDVDIYEQAPELTELGAGISLLPRSWNIMKKLGLDTVLSEIASQVPNDKPDLMFQYRKSDQTQGFTFYEIIMDGELKNFHRADFQNLLLEKLPETYATHLSSRLISYSEGQESVRLEFENGFTADCHILIGADGIKSVVRNNLMKDLSNASANSNNIKVRTDTVWTGTSAYRGLVQSDHLAARFPNHRTLTTPTMYCGKNKHLVVYPVSNRRLVNVVAFFSDPTKEDTVFDGPWMSEASKDEILAHYVGWEDEVQALLECIGTSSRWAIHFVRPLDSYVSNRVAVIGDAAHAMAPHQGSGAGQAIEDAYVLSHLIRNRNASLPHATVPHILDIYNKVRQPLGNRVLLASRQQGFYYELNGPGFEDVTEGDDSVSLNRLEELMRTLLRSWDWAWTTSADDDVQRALELL